MSTKPEMREPLDLKRSAAYANQAPIGATSREYIRDLIAEVEHLRGQLGTLQADFNDAYLAFKGAFDTPMMRQKIGDDYANDARTRLRDFSEKISALPNAKEHRAA
ncbi:TPA: hypothetical protein ACYLN4_006609 [Burkholderia lata]